MRRLERHTGGRIGWPSRCAILLSNGSPFFPLPASPPPLLLAEVAKLGEDAAGACAGWCLPFRVRNDGDHRRGIADMDASKMPMLACVSCCCCCCCCCCFARACNRARSKSGNVGVGLEARTSATCVHIQCTSCRSIATGPRRRRRPAPHLALHSTLYATTHLLLPFRRRSRWSHPIQLPIHPTSRTALRSYRCQSGGVALHAHPQRACEDACTSNPGGSVVAILQHCRARGEDWGLDRRSVKADPLPLVGEDPWCRRGWHGSA